MSGFTANTDDISKLKMDAKTTLKASDIRVHDFSFDGREASASADIMDRVTEAAQQAARAHPAQGLKLDAFDVDFSGLAANLGDEGPEGPLLREARRLIASEEYQQALRKLQEIFQIDEDHHEAIYLQAFCEHKLEKVSRALRTLRRLKDALLTNRLNTRVEALKAELRQEALARAGRIYTQAVKTRQTQKAIPVLAQLVEDDPEVGKYHCFLAGVHVVAKQHDDALQVLSAGLEVAESDREELEQFRGQIESKFVPRQLAPARDLFRKKQYQAARETLQTLPEECRRSALWMTFDGYLERLCGKKGGLLARFLSSKPDSVDPPGSPQEVEALYEFLIARELKAARAAVDAGDHGKAERALKQALTHTPRYSLANHLYATSVYQRVGGDVRARIGKDIDQAAADRLSSHLEVLRQARTHAEFGSRDKGIKDARRLVKSIDELCRQIDGVVSEFQHRQQDAKLVNQAIDDFIGILVSIFTLQSNIHNRYQARQEVFALRRKLESMNSTLPRLKRQCHGSEAKQIMTTLQTKFVDPNLRALRQAMGQ